MTNIISIISVGFMYATIAVVLVTCLKINRYINIKTEEMNKQKAYEEAKRELQEINDQLTQNKPNGKEDCSN